MISKTFYFHFLLEYLLRIPEMKDRILRVYGSLIEQNEYPISNKIASLKPPRSDDELKIPEGKLRDVALHHFIRNPPSPYAKELRRMEDKFKQQKDEHVRASDEDIKLYCKVRTHVFSLKFELTTVISHNWKKNSILWDFI